MKTLKRFRLSLEPKQTLEIPFNSEILGLVSNENCPALVVLIDSTYTAKARNLIIVAENKELPQRCNKTNCLGYFEYKAEVGSHVLAIFDET